MPPLAFAVRSELDLPIDEAGYSRMALEAMERLSADMERYLKHVRVLGVLPPDVEWHRSNAS
jgi:hypothetical protein